MANILPLLSPHSAVSYALIINPGGPCGGPEGPPEAIEFSMRTNQSGVYGPWVPLRFTRRRSRGQPYEIDYRTSRGYVAEVHRILSTTVTVTQELTICGESLLPADATEVQFRWVNTVGEGKNTEDNIPDTWAIFNATAYLNNSDGNTFEIFDSSN